jgi:hypothetical protein
MRTADRLASRPVKEALTCLDVGDNQYLIGGVYIEKRDAIFLPQ